MTTAARVATLDRVLGDRPQVHVGGIAGAAPDGVWATSRACYEFLAENSPSGARSLETGLGVSTVLFTAWGFRHTCMVLEQEQVELCSAYLDDRGIDRTNTRFVVGPSERTLPAADLTPIDVLFIDGNHGFPGALIDWYYAAPFLVAGGLLVIDDTQLPTVELGLLTFLRADPRWEVIPTGTQQWSAFRRVQAGTTSEGHGEQTFLQPPSAPFAARVARKSKKGVSSLRGRFR